VLKRLFGKGHSGDRLAAEGGNDYERSRDPFDVIKKLKKAIALGLDAYPLDRAQTFLGAACGDAGLADEAEAAYEAALRHNPANSTALSNLGMIHERRGQLTRARDHYERAIAANPNNGFAHNNLGVLLLKSGDNRAARPVLERAAELNPTLSVAFANLARCCANLGDFGPAQVAFRGASQRGYDGIEDLERELRDKQAAMPPIYFDEAAFLRLAERLLPPSPDVQKLLRRAIANPHGLHVELVAGGRDFYASEAVVAHALPWLLLCAEVTTRRLGVPGAERDIADWFELVTGAARRRGLAIPTDSALREAMQLRVEAGEHREDPSPLFDFFHALTADWKIVLLRLWETAEQAIVCPLARDDWEAIAYPYTEGPDGPGKIDLLAEPTPRVPAGGLN
jgi:hypothetical protein